jgi:hypothetical protein
MRSLLSYSKETLMSIYAIFLPLTLLFHMPEQHTGGLFAQTNLDQAQLPGNAPKADILAPSIDVKDKGCCVWKKGPSKHQWECSRNTTREYCFKTARELGIDYEFYKDKQCVDVEECKE